MKPTSLVCLNFFFFVLSIKLLFHFPVLLLLFYFHFYLCLCPTSYSCNCFSMNAAESLLKPSLTFWRKKSYIPLFRLFDADPSSLKFYSGIFLSHWSTLSSVLSFSLSFYLSITLSFLLHDEFFLSSLATFFFLSFFSPTSWSLYSRSKTLLVHFLLIYPLSFFLNGKYFFLFYELRNLPFVCWVPFLIKSF